MGKRLYVGNLPYDTDEPSLRDTFGQEGRQVQSVHIVMDRETGRPRGFAFVEMVTDEDAKKAMVALDGKDFRGRMLRINEAEERRAPGSRPGGPGGPRPGGFGGPRPAAGGGFSSGGAGAGGEAGGGPRRNFGADALPAEDRNRKYTDKKVPKRKHDEDPDFGGKRGSRRFDDDDDA